MIIVDAQVHIWDVHSAARPWPDPDAMHNNKAVKNHNAGSRPMLAEDLLRHMRSAGVDRAILVPPGWDGGKNDLAIKAVQKYPDRFAIMGQVPVKPPAPDLLTHWKEQPGMLGVRITFSNQNAANLTNGAADWLWLAAERAGVPVMVFPPHLLGHFHAIAERHPGLKIVIDHLALEVDNKKDAEAFAELPELLSLARHPNIAVKASCLTYHSGEPYPHPKLQPYIRQVFDAFGPERTFWGSDFTRLPSYKQSVTLFTEELPWLKGADKEWVMGRAVCEWLRWHPPVLR